MVLNILRTKWFSENKLTICHSGFHRFLMEYRNLIGIVDTGIVKNTNRYDIEIRKPIHDLLKKQFLLFGFALLLISSLSIPLSAQNDTSYVLPDNVVVSASRFKQSVFSAPEAISTLDYQQIELTNPMNMANSLFGVNGVWMQQTNNGGGSPIVRGLTYREPNSDNDRWYQTE
ncbi:MAG: hypothetical protein GXO85_16145 [Chlorobi bacterium]|nr:hypothetical protein [Chlorobiota bacterium]